jgi:(p)ppGpp synthase/HD superfamily hydrolase
MSDVLGARFRDALTFAFDLHRTQERKGSGVPYIAHLLGVASLVIEYGGDEDQAIGGLLHDAAEDQGGQATLDAIRARFGDRVADIVAGCSDTIEVPKPPWRERKERYLAHLRSASPSVQLVSACDKLYNARTIAADLERGLVDVWARFTGGRDGSIWYYRSLASEFVALGSPVARELERVVDAITTHA